MNVDVDASETTTKMHSRTRYMLFLFLFQILLVICSALFYRERKALYIYYYGVYSCLQSSISSSNQAYFQSSERDQSYPSYARVEHDREENFDGDGHFQPKLNSVDHYDKKHADICQHGHHSSYRIPYWKQLYFFVFDFFVAHIYRCSAPISFGLFTVPFQNSQSAQLLCQHSRVISDPFELYDRPYTCDNFLFLKYNTFLTGLYFWSIFAQVVLFIYLVIQDRNLQSILQSHSSTLSSLFLSAPPLMQGFPLSNHSFPPPILPPNLSPPSPSVSHPKLNPSAVSRYFFQQQQQQKSKPSSFTLQSIAESPYSVKHIKSRLPLIENLRIPGVDENELSNSSVFGGDFIDESEMEDDCL